jgi:8-oxo-dGTP pyrophosphatase MutT (NUDIX family)
MYTFDHAHFFELDRLLPDDVDTLFHGHGLDYLFQGMYLPTRRIHVLGRRTFVEELEPMMDAVEREYIEQVGYRLTNGTPTTLFALDELQERKSHLEDSLSKVLEDVPGNGVDDHDRWDFLHSYHTSRHYTHLNVLSMEGDFAQRTVAFDNDLYDLYWSMPPEMRVNGRAFRGANARVNPSVLQARNANTNLPATTSPLKSISFARLYAVLPLTPGISTSHEYPGPADRSWPNRDKLIRECDGIRTRAEGLGNSDGLSALGLFNLVDVERAVEDHLARRTNLGAGILTLITIDEFLRQGGIPS